MSRLLSRNRYKERNIFERHINEHIGIYVILCVLFVVGFTIGSISASFIKEEVKFESQSYILTFVEYLKTQEIDNNILLRESIIANIKPIIYIMLFGLIFIGIPFVFAYIGLYTYSLGFTVTTIMASLGVKKGIIFILTMMLPQEIVLLPTISIVSVNAILFSKIMLKPNRNINLKKESIKYLIVFAIGIAITMGVSLFETYVGSNLTKLAIKIVT